MYRSEIREALTDREREIVHLVSYGMSAKEAALELGIAPCTIERHVENVRQKTCTRNRVHMVAHLLRNGLMRDDRSEERLSA